MKAKHHPEGKPRGVRDPKKCMTQSGGRLVFIRDGQPEFWSDRPPDSVLTEQHPDVCLKLARRRRAGSGRHRGHQMEADRVGDLVEDSGVAKRRGKIMREPRFNKQGPKRRRRARRDGYGTGYDEGLYSQWANCVTHFARERQALRLRIEWKEQAS